MILGEKSERRDKSFFSCLEYINFRKSLPRVPEFEYPPLLKVAYSQFAISVWHKKPNLFAAFEDIFLFLIFISIHHFDSEKTDRDVILRETIKLFCCVLGKDTLRHFPLLGGLGKQF